MRSMLTVLFGLLISLTYGQIDNIESPFWWSDMQSNQLQYKKGDGDIRRDFPGGRTVKLFITESYYNIYLLIMYILDIQKKKE